ncbi:PP2C family serine/threonine-protein phosphatase [Neobacillus sp. D3-1R]|uniref:PP2C family serine/threonine-protein phosphatase n=1 Tax=Neobacillus sp. D3-1R TaxID=3445778 RepID=UPI003FA13C70
MTEYQKNIEVYAHQSTKVGKTQCGDGYFFIETEDYFICVVADGLGSGKYAHEASSAVTEIIEKNHQESVESLMKECNRVLFEKRGAAVSIFKVYFHSREFVYSCVGNIRFYLYTPNGHLIYPLPVSGYLSGRPQVYHTQRFSYEPNSKFLIHSDGFVYQGIKNLLKPYLSVKTISDEIARKFGQSNDDATVIVGSLLS